ncbi:M23 family metallopeptidase [Planotetraspora sp. GP83]|uniref:M23 family metallopeptidase n=1 Tax=Planotetraspora sp. GP83 TaxID=3156264 RepID=UPI003515B257
MRRLAALTSAACLAAACSAPAGVAGVSTLPPAQPVTSGGGAATAAADPSHMVAVAPPPGDAPVRLPPPTLSRFTYRFPVKGCRASYSRKLLVLPKTTIWAGKGCAFVSPVDGVVHEVNVKNLWKPSTDRGADREGRFVSVLGEDGVLYLGGHLDSVEPAVRAGTHVKAGQQLGRIGNSGNARDMASNLYFAVSWPTPSQYWWVRRGMVEPWPYLDAWYDGNATLSPRKATLAMRRHVGALPRCVQLCTSKSPVPAKETKPPKDDTDDTRVVIPLN